MVSISFTFQILVIKTSHVNQTHRTRIHNQMKTALILGHAVTFTRRHYGGGQFYCWVQVSLTPGAWTPISDPWPCHTPKYTEIETEIRRLKNLCATTPSNPSPSVT
jgi:hypothetical protein